MESVFALFERSHTLEPHAKEDLKRLGKIKRYQKGVYYKHEDEFGFKANKNTFLPKWEGILVWDKILFNDD